jgi:hypothetical protein
MQAIVCIYICRYIVCEVVSAQWFGGCLFTFWHCSGGGSSCSGWAAAAAFRPTASEAPAVLLERALLFNQKTHTYNRLVEQKATAQSLDRKIQGRSSAAILLCLRAVENGCVIGTASGRCNKKSRRFGFPAPVSRKNRVKRRFLGRNSVQK